MYQETSFENPGQITSSKVRKQAKQGLEPKTVISTFLQFFFTIAKKVIFREEIWDFVFI